MTLHAPFFPFAFGTFLSAFPFLPPLLGRLVLSPALVGIAGPRHCKNNARLGPIKALSDSGMGRFADNAAVVLQRLHKETRATGQILYEKSSVYNNVRQPIHSRCL